MQSRLPRQGRSPTGFRPKFAQRLLGNHTDHLSAPVKLRKGYPPPLGAKTPNQKPAASQHVQAACHCSALSILPSPFPRPMILLRKGWPLDRSGDAVWCPCAQERREVGLREMLRELRARAQWPAECSGPPIVPQPMDTVGVGKIRASYRPLEANQSTLAAADSGNGPTWGSVRASCASAMSS